VSSDDDIPVMQQPVEIPVLSDRVSVEAPEVTAPEVDDPALLKAALLAEMPYLIDDLLADAVPRLEQALRDRLAQRARELLDANLK